MSNNKYKTLFSNTLLISIGTFGSKLLVFLMVRFYTGYLAPSDYGTADLITQTANLLFPIVSLGITEGVFRFAMDSSSDRKSVFSYGLFAIMGGLLLFLGIAPLLGLVSSFDGYVWLILVYTVAYCLHSLCSQYIRAIGKTAFFAVQGIINTMLVIALNILFLAVFDMGITGYVLSVAVADIFCTLLMVIKEKLWRVVTFKPDKRLLKPMLKYSIPLIPTTVFWWVTSVSDRYMVNGIVGSGANGIYTVSYKLPTLLTIVSTIFMQAWQFSAVTESDTNEEEHREFFSNVWQSFQAVMFLSGSVIVLFAKPAIKLLTDKDYYSAWKFVPLLSAAMVFTALTSFMGTVYVVKKKSLISFYTALIGAVSNIVLNFLLIPSYLEAQGAAIATVASYLLVFIIRAENSQKYIKFNLQRKYVAINSAIIFVQSIVVITEFKFWQIVAFCCTVLMFAVNIKFIMSFVNRIFSTVFGGGKK